MTVWTIAPSQIVTPSPVPALDPPPVGWATGLASSPTAIAALDGNGAGFSGVPGEPFANGPGGSTLQATFLIHRWLQLAIRNAGPGAVSMRLSFDARINRPLPLDVTPGDGFSDGWSVGLGQNPLDPPLCGAFGLYSDAIHLPIWEGLGYVDLGQLSQNWTRYTVAADERIDAVDWAAPLVSVWQAEQSTEPQAIAWTFFARALRLTVETRSA